MNKRALKIGLIGLGRMGQNHLRILSLLKDVELVFVVDSDPELATRVGATYAIPGVTDLMEVLDSADAIVICTPTVNHASCIRQAAEKVTNIFVEKPLADTLEEARLINDLVVSKNLNLQVGFIERFNPAVQGIRSILRRSQQVISIDFTRTNKVSSRILDVDVITDLMIHDIDLALYLNGPMRSLTAHGFAKSKMIDYVSALITHENGSFSRIQASRITDKKVRQIEATCSDMFIDCDLLRKEIIINRQSETQQQENQPYVISTVQEIVEVRPQEALLLELQAFVASCHGNPNPEIPNALDGLASMQVCDEIQKMVMM